jgi:hypothetical protein
LIRAGVGLFAPPCHHRACSIGSIGRDAAGRCDGLSRLGLVLAERSPMGGSRGSGEGRCHNCLKAAVCGERRVGRRTARARPLLIRDIRAVRRHALASTFSDQGWDLPSLGHGVGMPMAYLPFAALAAIHLGGPPT